ncbi:MAG: glycosyltransferase [Balneolaceae bacterium]|nr:glycosyltransferase [Balneolaceae bacterium]
MSSSLKYVSLYENSGYGIAAKLYLKALLNSDIDVTWTPMVRGKGIGMTYEPYQKSEIGESELDSICNKPIEYDTVLVHTIPEFFSYWREQEPDKYLIGYTVWETTKPPDHWKDLINQLDHLLVPTLWNKKIFREHGIIIPIDVLPHMSEFEGIPLQNEELLDETNDRFLFYIISTWTERKAIWKLIDAYVKAFNKNDHVELLIKTSKGDMRNPRNILLRYLGYTYQPVRKTFKNYLKRFNNHPKISLVADESMSKEYIHQLHTRGDCYVSLCRGEGWGIGSFEAARFGKPVIMTGFGGQTDYLQPEYSWLVDYELIPVVDKNAPKSYGSDQNWAEPNIEQAAEFMRYVYEHQEEAKRKGEKLKEYVMENFSNERTAGKLIQFLRSV